MVIPCGINVSFLTKNADFQLYDELPVSILIQKVFLQHDNVRESRAKVTESVDIELLCT